MGDLLRSLRGKLTRTLEAEKFAGGIAGFYHSVGEQGELSVVVEEDGCFGVFGCFVEAERQSVIDFNFAGVDVRRDVSGIGEDERTVWVEAENEACREPAVTTGEH